MSYFNRKEALLRTERISKGRLSISKFLGTLDPVSDVHAPVTISNPS